MYRNITNHLTAIHVERAASACYILYGCAEQTQQSLPETEHGPCGP